MWNVGGASGKFLSELLMTGQQVWGLTSPRSLISCSSLFPTPVNLLLTSSLLSKPDFQLKKVAMSRNGLQESRSDHTLLSGLVSQLPQVSPHSIPSGTGLRHFSAHTEEGPYSPLVPGNKFPSYFSRIRVRTWYQVWHEDIAFIILNVFTNPRRKLLLLFCVIYLFLYSQYYSNSICGHVCILSIIP